MTTEAISSVFQDVHAWAQRKELNDLHYGQNWYVNACHVTFAIAVASPLADEQ